MPFAGIARSAFIAKDILSSFVDQKIISHDDFSNFMGSVSTVTSDISKSLNKLGKKEFLKKYGHLRPNTYDINSKIIEQHMIYILNQSLKIIILKKKV